MTQRKPSPRRASVSWCIWLGAMTMRRILRWRRTETPPIREAKDETGSSWFLRSTVGQILLRLNVVSARRFGPLEIWEHTTECSLSVGRLP